MPGGTARFKEDGASHRGKVKAGGVYFFGPTARLFSGVDRPMMHVTKALSAKVILGGARLVFPLK